MATGESGKIDFAFLQTDMKTLQGEDKKRKLQDLFSLEKVHERMGYNYVSSLMYIDYLMDPSMYEGLTPSQKISLGEEIFFHISQEKSHLDPWTYDLLEQGAVALLAEVSECQEGSNPFENYVTIGRSLQQRQGRSFIPSDVFFSQSLQNGKITYLDQNKGKPALQEAFRKIHPPLHHSLLSHLVKAPLEGMREKTLYIKASHYVLQQFSFQALSSYEEKEITDLTDTALKLLKRIHTITQGSYLGKSFHGQSLFSLEDDQCLHLLNYALLLMKGNYDQAKEIEPFLFSEPSVANSRTKEKRKQNAKERRAEIFSAIKEAQAQVKAEDAQKEALKKKQAAEIAERTQRNAEQRTASTIAFAAAVSSSETTQQSKAEAREALKKEEEKRAARENRKATSSLPESEEAATASAPAASPVDQNNWIEINPAPFETFRKLMSHEKGQFTKTEIMSLLSAFGGTWDDNRGAGSHRMVFFKKPQTSDTPASASSSSSAAPSPKKEETLPIFASLVLGNRLYRTWTLPNRNELLPYLLVQLRNIFTDAGLDLSNVR